jgi:hypothetical protein
VPLDLPLARRAGGRCVVTARMPEAAPVLSRAYTSDDLERLVRRGNATLERRLAVAEAEVDDARELARDLKQRLAWAETDRDRLLRAQGSRLLPWTAAGSVAGLAGGALMLLARWAGW